MTPRLTLDNAQLAIEPDHHDGGLAIDLQHLAGQQAGRRRALRLLGVFGALALGGAAAARRPAR